jgi:hypothetical protein
VAFATTTRHSPLDGPDARLDTALGEHLRNDDGVALGLGLEQRDGFREPGLVEPLLRRMALHLRGRAATEVPAHRVPGQSQLAGDRLRAPSLRCQVPHMPDRLRLHHRHLHRLGCHGRHFADPLRLVR